MPDFYARDSAAPALNGSPTIALGRILMDRDEERSWVGVLLLITVSMGMLDAISLLHFGTFTGYMTGTVILIGIGFARLSAIATSSLVALGAFLLGALVGGRLIRRRQPSPKLVADILMGVAVLVGLAALVQGLIGGASFAVIAILGLAMGLQTSATRFAAVADMSMPAATMILHGLAHDSRLAGGKAERAWRRLGILVGLIGGAAIGALLSAWHVWIGLAAVALLVFVAAAVLRAANRS